MEGSLMDIEKQILVGPTDTDPYNIVHHPVYFNWMEQAILQWILETYGSMNSISYTIEQFQCKFISSAKLYDELSLRLHPKRKENRILFQGKITNQKNNQLLVEESFFVRIEGESNEQ